MRGRDQRRAERLRGRIEQGHRAATVCRMLDRGLPVERIAVVTGLPVEVVAGLAAERRGGRDTPGGVSAPG